MAASAPKKRSNVLDALDQNFLSSTDAAMDTSPVSSTPLQRDLLQTPNPTQGSSSKMAALEAFRASQATQDAGRMLAAVDASYLVDSFVPSSSGRKVAGGFSLNYDMETPIRPIDVGGPDQEQRLADFVTRSIENTSNGLTVKEAMKRLGLKDKRDLLPGLEVRLLSHQVIGVSWMLERERSHDRGGILADDMGLGKTVQMIATMAMNMPGQHDDIRTTLIVVPAALLQQWKDEVDTKTNGMFKVHVHHGKDKVKILQVLITSYQTFCQDFAVPKGTPPEEEEEYLQDHGGLLYKAKFFRVIADEAQFIRNRSTRASISLALVKSRYRWMLTGTPVTNTLADIYGLLRFGRFRPWNDWNDFNEHIAKVQYEDAPLAGQRAQAILKPILLRRTKNSTLEGKPLLELPTKHIEIVKLQFTPDERAVYEFFEKKTKIQVNRYMREGTLAKNHTYILVLILRLRQACCHPHLVLAQGEKFEDPAALLGTKAEKEFSRAKKIMGAAWVNEIKQRFLLRAASAAALDFDDEADDPVGTCPNCNDMFVNDSGRVLACGHEICFDCALDLSNSPIAHDGIFGYGSEKENMAAEKEYEAAVAKGHRPCPTCKKMMDMKSPDKVFKASAFEPTEEDLGNHARDKRRARHDSRKGFTKKRSPSPVKVIDIPDVLDDSDDDLPEVGHMLDTPLKKQRRKLAAKKGGMDEDMIELTEDDSSPSHPKKRKSKGYDSDSDLEVIEDKRQKGGKGRVTSGSQNKGKGKQKDNGDPSEAVMATWSRGDDDFEPSSKMVQLIGFLKEWEVTGDKTICYSQWTSMLDLIEKLFSRHGIRTLRFDGRMDRAERDSTLAEFKQFGGPKVMLISTKCGSVGLNLVSANRIINMDLSWNYAAEAQAYDRCHRIGQEKDVYVKRLVVEDTIEDRMLQLQDVKTGLAEAALGEGTGTNLHKLSVKDIKYVRSLG
ncbi:SNF2 family N-terminal domain-containing protein [Gymnopilus junonius]|uniref:SNF2 family N-terminal domain-containing protein n=1 Tax=Gymnopilus junonius TaxID=109634 RepID=A0A9P5TKU5_GYMJU|nr:SNF2 family N-terminal domain-containing protein [Gymnopilus junonius]